MDSSIRIGTLYSRTSNGYFIIHRTRFTGTILFCSRLGIELGIKLRCWFYRILRRYEIIFDFLHFTICRSMWPEGANDITATTKRPLTAGTIFKNSMNALMKILASKDPFYVRCIKVLNLRIWIVEFYCSVRRFIQFTTFYCMLYFINIWLNSRKISTFLFT